MSKAQAAREVGISRETLYNSVLKFFQVDRAGILRMTSSARYFK